MDIILSTTDADIRTALHKKKLKVYRKAPDTIIVDELGLVHARVRIDVAVINGFVHGYEIKSGLDTLDRLPSQLDCYRRCLSKLTLVVSTNHIGKVQKLLPTWVGILEAKKGRRGGISFATVRYSKSNPDIEAVQLAHLLWKSEAAALLARFGASSKELRQPRKLLYARLAEIMSVEQLTTSICEFMRKRTTWRDPPGHALCDGL